MSVQRNECAKDVQRKQAQGTHPNANTAIIFIHMDL